MQVLIMIIILYWLAQKIDIAVKAKRRRGLARAIAAEKAADRLRRDRERQAAAAERQARREAREAREADRERIRAEKELERREKAAKAADRETREKEQAETDLYFLIEQKALYQAMLKETSARLKVEKQKMQAEKEIDAATPGAISEKEFNRRQKEIDKLTRAVINLKNKIHALEVKQGKAYYKIDS